MNIRIQMVVSVLNSPSPYNKTISVTGGHPLGRIRRTVSRLGKAALATNWKETAHTSTHTWKNLMRLAIAWSVLLKEFTCRTLFRYIVHSTVALSLLLPANIRSIITDIYLMKLINQKN